MANRAGARRLADRRITMDPTLLMAGSFVVLLLLGVPVAVSIGFAAVVTMASANMPMSYLVQTAYSAVDEFTIIAVPMFILAGTLMEKGGLTSRLITRFNPEPALPSGLEQIIT